MEFAILKDRSPYLHTTVTKATVSAQLKPAFLSFFLFNGANISLIIFLLFFSDLTIYKYPDTKYFSKELVN